MQQYSFSVKRYLLLLFIGLMILNPGFSWSQTKLSKKESKQKEALSRSSRYFIEGEKSLVLGDLDKAFFYLQKAEDIYPNQPAVSYKIAEVLVRSNQAEKALPYAEKAALADPQNKYYALMVAEIYTNLKQPLKAAEILERLTAETEENQQYNLDLASIYLNAGEFDKALVVLDRAEEYYGIRDQFTIQKQRIYLRKNNLQAAITEGEKLIEAFPGNPNYVLNLVEILYNNAKVDDALTLVLGEIKKYPNQPELQMAAYTLLKEKGQVARAQTFLFSAFANSDLDPEVKARTYSSTLNEFKSAERELILDKMQEILLQVNGENAAVLAAIGQRFEKDQNLPLAIEFYKKSLQIDPKNASLLEQVILNSFGEGANLNQLETYTQLAVDEYPGVAEFWFYDGVVKSGLKKDSTALVSLKKSLELNAGKNTQLEQVAFSSLGNSLYNLGEKDSAFVYFDKALALNPNDEQVLNNYAYFLSLEKINLEKAKSMAEKVVKKYPDNSTYLDTLAWVLFQMGNYSEAFTYMNRAIQAEKEPSGTLLEHYGDILYHLGKTKEAIDWWKKAEGSAEASKLLSQKIKEGKYHE